MRVRADSLSRGSSQEMSDKLVSREVHILVILPLNEWTMALPAFLTLTHSRFVDAKTTVFSRCCYLWSVSSHTCSAEPGLSSGAVVCKKTWILRVEPSRSEPDDAVGARCLTAWWRAHLFTRLWDQSASCCCCWRSSSGEMMLITVIDQVGDQV